MFSTPKQAPLMMQPSVLFTPPFSSSKPLFYSPIMRMQFSPALPLPFASPAATPTPEQKDIPSELYLGGYPMVSEKVFSCLSGADLANCLQVCKTWNHQVSSNSHIMAQVKTHRRQCKENAENLHKSQTEQPLVALLQRRPLGSIQLNRKAPVYCTSAPHSTCSVIQKLNLPLQEQEDHCHPRRHDGEYSQSNFQCTSHGYTHTLSLFSCKFSNLYIEVSEYKCLSLISLKVNGYQLRGMVVQIV